MNHDFVIYFCHLYETNQMKEELFHLTVQHFLILFHFAFQKPVYNRDEVIPFNCQSLF